MDRDARRQILEAYGLNPDLLAVDPNGCGCTECLIGEYIPSDNVPRDQVPLYQSLIRQGVLSDHTSGWFMPYEPETFTREDMEAAFDAGVASHSGAYWGGNEPDFETWLRTREF